MFGSSRYSNQTGVEVRPLDWGGLGGLEALDPGLPQLTPLYRALAEALKDEGFVEREDLFGAPYDFRLAGDGLDQVGDRPLVIFIRALVITSRKLASTMQPGACMHRLHKALHARQHMEVHPYCTFAGSGHMQSSTSVFFCCRARTC